MKYCLQNKQSKQWAGFTTRSNKDGDFCCDIQYALSIYADDPLWVANTAEDAEYARLYSTHWYNANHCTPSHPVNWNPDDWEVVEIKSTPVLVKIPTFNEYLKEKYKKSNRAHYDHIMKTKQPDDIYTLYDLHELLRNREAQNA